MSRWLTCLCAAFLWSVVVQAKGPTTRIVIEGSGLKAPIEITDASVLRSFTVWSGGGTTINGVEQHTGFIVGWLEAVDEPPSGLPRYEISFYVKFAKRPLDTQSEQLAYVVLYELDRAGAGGYVYLPGKGEEGYDLNTRTILRGGGYEGHWFRANESWNRVALAILRP